LGRLFLWIVGLILPVMGWAQAATQLLPAQASRAYRPVHPYEALIANKGGWAEVIFTVDHSGRAMLLGVEGASDPDFARAWKAEIEAIEFIPPRPNGRPVLSRSKEKFFFPAQPSLDPLAVTILEELRKPSPAIVPADKLDKMPKAIRQPLPAYPWAQRADGESGKAVIEYVIDRNGRPLFPRIVSATHPDFGWAAATVIQQQWRFEPPMKNGEKVDARVTSAVEFDISKAGEMW
jgi:TonB family protein